MGVKYNRDAKKNPYIAYVYDEKKVKHIGAYATREQAEIASARYAMLNKGFTEETIELKEKEISERKTPRLRFGLIERKRYDA